MRAARIRTWSLCGLPLVAPAWTRAASPPAGHALVTGGGVWEFVAPLMLALSSLLLVVGIFVFWNRRLKDEIRKRTAAEHSLRRGNELLQCIDELRAQFIRDPAPAVLFPSMLEHLLVLTGSRFGFIGDVLTDVDGSRRIKFHALGVAPGDEAGGKLFGQYRRQDVELRAPHNLLGTALVTGKPVVANHLAADTASLGLPPGLPPINAFAGLPVYFGERLVGEVGLVNRPGGYNREIVDWIAPAIAALGQIIVARQDREAREQAENELRELATTDPLTRLANRRLFNSRLETMMAHARRYAEALTLLMLDIDRFKEVNDLYGHYAGDRILVELARLIEGEIREVDLLARWGGDEFMILLPRTPQGAGVLLAERLRRSVEAHDFERPAHLTISIGAVTLRPNEAAELLIARADAALYKAKNAGRNRVGEG